MNKDLLKRYLKYGIDMKKIQSIIRNLGMNTDYDKVKKQIEKEIVEELKKDNIDIEILLIDDYSYIKSQITKNKKYLVAENDIDKIYEDAIEMLKNSYDNSTYLSINILNNMKNIISSKYNPSIKEQKEIYDLSFLYEYVMYFTEDKEDYLNILSMVMDIQKSRLYDLLKGIKKANIDELLSLLSFFKVNDYEELKEHIERLKTSEIKTKKSISSLSEVNNEINTNNIVKSIDKMSNNELLEVLNIHQMSYKDALVSIMMFGGVIDKTIEEVSEFLSIDKSEVEDIINRDIKILKYRG